MRLSNINHQISHTRANLSHSSPASTGVPAAPPSLVRATPLSSSLTLNDTPQHSSLVSGLNSICSNRCGDLTRSIQTITRPLSIPEEITQGKQGSNEIENPFENWFQNKKSVTKKTKLNELSSTDVSYDSFPQRIGLLRSPPSSINGDYTDCEMDLEEDEINGENFNNTRRYNAIVDAQSHFRCMEMDCLLDCSFGVPPPPILYRAQAQMLLYHEDIDVTCQKCGAVDSITISY